MEIGKLRLRAPDQHVPLRDMCLRELVVIRTCGARWFGNVIFSGGLAAHRFGVSGFKFAGSISSMSQANVCASQQSLVIARGSTSNAASGTATTIASDPRMFLRIAREENRTNVPFMDENKKRQTQLASRSLASFFKASQR